MTRVYFDVCCLNRPFNDQTQDRIRLEAFAVLSVLRRIEMGEWLGITSEAAETEIANDTNVERRTKVQKYARLAKVFVIVGEDETQRSLELQAFGFGAYDALHVACAERAESDVLLTVDDRFLRIAVRIGNALHVKVANPVNWLLEILQND